VTYVLKKSRFLNMTSRQRGCSIRQQEQLLFLLREELKSQLPTFDYQDSD